MVLWLISKGKKGKIWINIKKEISDSMNGMIYKSFFYIDESFMEKEKWISKQLAKLCQ